MRFQTAVILFLVSLPVFYFAGFEGGYLENEISLGKELQAPPDNLSEWNLSKNPPFQYRILFKSLVVQLRSTVLNRDPHGFYHSYIIISYLSFFASIFALFYLIRINGYLVQYAYLGVGLYLISPAVLMAYKIPVHLREDFLAYALLLLALIAISRKSDMLLILVMILGPFCRETLLLIPFVYLFFTNYDSLTKRVVISALPFIIIVGIRMWFGTSSYEIWHGLYWNMANPVQVLGFLIITFHFMWVPLVIYFIFRNRLTLTTSFFDKSTLPVILLVMLTTFIGGIFNEIRLLFLAFPWVILSVLNIIQSNKYLNIQPWFSKPEIRMFVLIQPILIIGLFFMLQNIESIDTSKYNVPYEQWIILSFLYIDLILFGLIHYFGLFKSNKTPKNE